MNFRFFWIIFVHFLCRICNFFCEFLMKFCSDFATNSRKEWRVSLFQSNLRKHIGKIAENSEIRFCEKYSLLFIIIHYYSFVSLGPTLRCWTAGKAGCLPVLRRPLLPLVRQVLDELPLRAGPALRCWAAGKAACLPVLRRALLVLVLGLDLCFF